MVHTNAFVPCPTAGAGQGRFNSPPLIPGSLLSFGGHNHGIGFATRHRPLHKLPAEYAAIKLLRALHIPRLNLK